MPNYFEEFAEVLVRDFGAYYDREEGFVICPECDEPLYECDWEPSDYRRMAADGHLLWVCPVCEEILSVEDEF